MARSHKNNANRKRMSKKVVKAVKVGDLSAKTSTFAARLGAFLLDDHHGKVRWSAKNGFAAGQPHIFGVLPYLHINVTESQFRNMLNNGKGSEVSSLVKVCQGKKLDKHLKGVGFSCQNQSNVGVNALVESIISSINQPERWNSRRNGRRVLSMLQRLMTKQNEDLKVIPGSSLQWSRKC